MRNTANASSDVVVIGAGVIGLSVAFELLEAGRGVTLLERSQPGCGATAAAAGMIAPVSEAEAAEPELVRLGQDSLERYPGFVERVEGAAGLSCGYRTEGTLWIAIDRDNAAEIDRLAQTLALKGLRAERLGPREIGRRDPHLSGRVVSGLFVEQDHQVDPRALSRCLAAAVRARGGTIRCDATVQEVARLSGGGWSVSGVSAGGEAFTGAGERVVLAAGAWSGRDLAWPGGAPPLRPVKGQLVRLKGPRLLRHVIRTPDVYLVPHGEDELLVGATMEEMGFDTVPTAGAVGDLLRRAWEVLPGIYDLALSEVSVGLRPAFEDHLPRIGALAHDGLFVALGHFRHGLLLAPATAAHLSGWIVSGRAPAELAPFAPVDAVELQQ